MDIIANQVEDFNRPFKKLIGGEHNIKIALFFEGCKIMFSPKNNSIRILEDA